MMMADGIDGGDFWLPSSFLPDGIAAQNREDRRVPWEALGFNRLNLGDETESDEEDYLAGLTRRMTHAFLQDDDDINTVLARDYPKGQAMAGSPQSTLCDLGIWSGSNQGSPEGPSQVSSPPATAREQPKELAWDLLTAAASQVVRLRLAEQAHLQKFHGRGLLAPPAKLSTPLPAARKNVAGTGVYYGPSLTQQQKLQAERFYQLKQQQLMKNQISSSRQPSRGCGGGFAEERCGRPHVMPSSGWSPHHRPHQPPPQSQHHSMRGVFVSGAGARKESTGTGVFLPRRPGDPSDLRRKPASPSVKSQEQGFSASNLNLDDMGSYPRLLDHDALVSRGNRTLPQQRRFQYRRPAASPAADYDNLRLPAEWTY